MKLLFPEELIDENLEGFKEKVTRTLKLFPKACAKGHSWRDCLSSCESPTRYSLQGEKTWRIKDASCLYLLLSAKPYSQAKDLKQALHGRQPMRIEGEKGVKTQSAPNHWPRTRKEILAEQFQPGRPSRSSREGIAARPD
ncbi:unnamed protein product [Microthlaspi erraticum]|uniref:Uncharacterized protein n=1 Tax=Microthlaspi erraticum TaxID=1685480 RepID=A0A6D2KSJ1_9BRAS|nr:unnamed protein product [Microthlaspi erraticum]